MVLAHLTGPWSFRKGSSIVWGVWGLQGLGCKGTQTVLGTVVWDTFLYQNSVYNRWKDEGLAIRVWGAGSGFRVPL